MKRYLIIAMDIGLSAPGIVYAKLIREMQKMCDISIICPAISKQFSEAIEVLPCKPYKRFRNRIEKLLFKYFGKNISDQIWSRKVTLQYLKTHHIDAFDGIISFTSCYNFATLYLGRLLSKELKKKWIIYSVDAIPAPLDWNDDRQLHKHVNEQLKKTVVNADAFFSSNPIMLEYELGLFGDFNGNTGVVLTPHDYSANYKKINHTGISFLYTGNIYGPRKVDALVAAFDSFSKEHPDSTLTFVGHFFANISEQHKHLVDEGKIIIHKFTEKITTYYESADVLIDIASIHPNDVFLSSKIVNYLPVSKPIIAISGENSPVRLLFDGIPTVLQCHHNPDEVLQALNNSLKFIDSDFEDRKEIVHRFAVETVTANFIKEIESI